MAQYQVPQFLESGDKILGPLNMRQFGYVLVGGFVSFIIYSIVSSSSPALGAFAIIPAAPVFLLSALIALGKYNGRDIEVYVFKFIVAKVKPRQLVYSRVPDMSDLEKKLGFVNETSIQKEWANRVAEQNATKNGIIANFRDGNSDEKAQKIRDLSFTIDSSVRNTLASVKSKEIELEEHKHNAALLTNIKNKNRQYSQSPLLNQTPKPLQQLDQTIGDINFLSDKK
jgi:hypothetical protein